MPQAKGSIRMIKNARHGLYARFFDDLEESAISHMGDEIDAELKALRVSASRLFERASSESRDWESEMRLLEAFGKQCVAVATLVRTKKIVDTISGESGAAIRKALEIADDDWEFTKGS